MAAYDDKSPLATAIDKGRMEIWNIMREGLELTDQEKLEQLCRMIMAGKMEQDEPWKEFKELLSSLPLELVIFELYFGRGHIAFLAKNFFYSKQGVLLERNFTRLAPLTFLQREAMKRNALCCK